MGNLKRIFTKEVFELLISKGYAINPQGEVFNSKGKMLSLKCVNSDGYRHFSLICKDRKRRITFHQFQAYMKYGDKLFDKGMVVRHKNGNRLDNSWSNIVLGTQRDNMLDRDPEERLKHSIKATKKHVRKDWGEIELDREKGMSYKALSKKYGVSTGTLSYRFNKSQKVEQK